MQTLRKKTSPCKYRNDPGRFFGDGVKFKAKLIGILEVGEARGDRMCQEALQDLKMALRAAGEHKQRITIHVTIDGLRLRDEKTGDSLYHHPVHKISFIAQDMTDSRAFGYIFGSPDSGHRFFGIKTDKAASQVVLAMRDLFQVVFELKKKEIELARQQIQSKTLHEHQLASLSSLKVTGGGLHNDLSGGNCVGGGSGPLTLMGGGNVNGQTTCGVMSRLGVNLDSKGAAAKELSPESVADLVDLEQELSSIQRGITQMERITPNEPMQTHMSGGGGTGAAAGKASAGEEDPFGDSFTNFPTYNLLPPPESGRSRNKTVAGIKGPGESGSTPLAAPSLTSLLSPAPAHGSPASSTQQQHDDDDDSWLHEIDQAQQQDIFETSKSSTVALSLGGNASGMPMAPLAASESSVTPTQQLNDLADLEMLVNASGNAAETGEAQAATVAAMAVKSDAFTDLDPLGTGRTRPYVDKKYFFHELKNPPKKVLKDLSASNAATVLDELLGKEDNGAVSSAITSTQQTPLVAVPPSTQPTQLPLNVTTTNTNTITNNSADAVMLPRDTDPFSPTRKKSDPFQEGGDIFAQLDPFEFEFAQQQRSAASVSPPAAAPSVVAASADVFNGPLQVSLPPEPSVAVPVSVSAPASTHPPAMGNGTISSGSSVRSRPVPSAQLSLTGQTPAPPTSHTASAFKQQTADVLTSISQKKMMPHLFGQSRFSKRSGGGGESHSINMRRLQESGDSLSETEAAPEPPPRPDSVSHAEPPPLPPKKQFSDIVIRPRVTSGSVLPPPPTHSATISSTACSARYEYLTKLSGSSTASGSDVPPIPLPSRRIGRSDGVYPGPGRPRKPGYTEDDYLAPINTASSTASSAGDVPPLLPPPTQSSTRGRTQRQQSLGSTSSSTAGGSANKAQDIYENKSEILQHQQQQQQKQQRLQQQQTETLVAPLLPDITLTQLLTLGIDELADKLSVPSSKLSTMTLVELTSYLAEFIEKSKPAASPAKEPPLPAPPTTTAAPVFKVNFDQQSTFVAKFDDTFGEDESRNADCFVANFAQFNESQSTPTSRSAAVVPSADRYAVFREIIDQELQHQREDTDLLGSEDAFVGSQEAGASTSAELVGVHIAPSGFEAHFEADDFLTPAEPPVPQAPKIDTKITEVVAQAKDRYAALRDIILVENLFDKATPTAAQQAMAAGDYLPDEFAAFGEEEFAVEDHDLKQIMDAQRVDREGLVDNCILPAEPSSSVLTVQEDDDEEEDEDGGVESSLDSNEKDGEVINDHVQDQYEQLSASNQQLDVDHKTPDTAASGRFKQDGKFLTVANTSGLSSSKDDLEIDELMQRAISNLSLDSREHVSPANSTHTPRSVGGGLAPSSLPQQQFNDVSTSPIPLQKSPVPAAQTNRSLLPPPKCLPPGDLSSKSPVVSPIPSQLSAVSNLIDTATKQMLSSGDMLSEGGDTSAKDSWATFDSPKTVTSGKRLARAGSKAAKTPAATTLHLPPPPPSNTSQNDTADSPCSSDPRDEGWKKTRDGQLVGGVAATRRWTKKERQQTSSSSRDLSPWDDETPDYQKQKRIGALPASAHDRHGYYVRHARRLNSCDEDYGYEDDFSHSARRERDGRKFKQGISRSRDNFELESPSWYHHAAPHHTWSPQDIEQAAALRARSFERSAYERSTYGPPIYDKRGAALPPPPPTGATSYERRTGGGTGYDKRKYFRDYARPNYEFDDYGEAPPSSYRDAGSFEKLGSGKLSGPRRGNDYENVYDESAAARYKAYIYERERERDRKSFDRESLESYDSATRRRRSFGSGGDAYGSLESRDEFRDRYMGTEKTRSLRKSVKLRAATGDVDYAEDSADDYQQPRVVRPLDTRSLQRPNQLVTTGGSLSGGVGTGQTRLRKSSGSSPWDGDEPPLPGQKQWKRPSSAAESERRLAESRRSAAAYGQTPSGSDGEKERRYRRKQRTRGKDLPSSTAPVVGGRYSNYDYITYDDNDEEDEDDDEDYDGPPTDEDKFERLNRRRHEMHQRMLESERRQHGHGPTTAALKAAASASKKYQHSNSSARVVGAAVVGGGVGGGADYDDDYEQTPTPRSNTSGGGGGGGGGSGQLGGKFSFDGGFESDFNQSSPPPAPAGTASSCQSTPAASASAASITPATKSSFRFSNDFSDRGDKLHGGFGAQHSTSVSSLQQFDLDGVASPATHTTPPITQKLRFDDNVKVSQFDDAAFEDDFAKAQFDFEKEDQWHADALQPSGSNTAALKKHNLRNSKLQQRQELIKKSESINIFAKKVEDPFEDDEFFQATPGETPEAGGVPSKNGGSNFQWDDDANFAKFDENM